MFMLGLAVALGVLLASQTIGRAMVAMKRDHSIRVKGTASADVKSDHGKWTAIISSRGTTLVDAYATLEIATAKAHAFIEARGFTKDEIFVFSVDSTTTWKQTEKGITTNEIEWYNLSQRIQVSSGKVELVRATSNEVTALIRDGVDINSLTPEFTVTTIESEKMRLLEQATQNGFERAGVMVRASGGKPGRLASASQGVFQIVASGSTDSSDYGSYDTTTIAKSVRAVVTLEYDVDE